MLKLIFGMLFIFTGGMSMLADQAKSGLTLEDIFQSDQFQGKTVTDVQWLPDGSAFTFTRFNAGSGERDIYRHNVATGEESLILDGGSLSLNGQPVRMTAYQTTGQQNTLLLTGPRKQLWRHSYVAPYYLYDITQKSLLPLAKGDPALQNVSLSPDGKRVAFARDNNLFVAEVGGGEPRALTQDGSFNILNGVFDWVYEEEFGRADAYRWSPDSKHIAFWRTDQTRVKTFTLLDELPYYSETTSLKYPKVGEQNAVVAIRVVDVASGVMVNMDLGENDDIYVPRIDWSAKPGTLAIQRLNRRQNRLELLFADIRSGKTHLVLEEQNEAWVDVRDDFIFPGGTDRIVWTSEKDGFRHIYLSDYQGRQLAQLTRGSWEVASVIGLDEKGGWVYCYGKKDSPAENQIYRVSLDGKKFEQVSRQGSWNEAVFAPDYQHYVGYSSDVRTPTRVDLYRADGKALRELERNHIAALEKFEMVYPEFLTVTTTDGVALSAFVMKPADFDPKRKYPVLVFGYGGPGSQMVLNRWGMGGGFRHLQRTLWHQMMTEKGYIVFCVDNRGTGGKGKAFKNLAYGDLSKWSVHDQIEGAKYLATLPYVDPARIGFWGWSGGGYLACLIQTRANDYFKTSVGVALVSDFRNYDTIWTERYMGLLSDNEAGYQAASVLNGAEKLAGNLLIVHGTGDDNVHPGNSWQLVEALVAANKQFEMMMYPNRNHRISGGNTSRHLFTRITNYFLENL